MPKKPNKIIILLVSLLIVIGFLGFGLWRGDTTQQAYAGDRGEPQLFGWAWTETIGWISMNCFGASGLDDYCPQEIDYGVSVNQITGKLKGYAWSENVGWISFGDPAGNLDYPYKGTADDPTKKCVDVIGNSIDCADGSCTACYNFDNHHLYGWAHIVSLEDDGWIRLDNPAVNQEWGVVQTDDLEDGDFYGWAWNGNDTPKTGIGWMSWNGSDGGGNYRVDGNPRKLSIVSVERTKGEESHSLTVKWNGDVYGETKFYVYRKGDGGVWEQVLYKDTNEVILGQDNTFFADGSRLPKTPEKIPLGFDEEYSYRIKACNMFGCTSADSQPKKTSPIDTILEIKINTTCDNTNASFVFEWPHVFALVPISYYEGQYCVTKAGQTADDCKEWIHAFVDKYFENGGEPFSMQSYRDPMDDRYNADKFNNHFYRIRAVSKKNGDYPTDDNCEDENGCDDIGSWAYTIRPVRPCVPPTQPKYQEVRPK